MSKKMSQEEIKGLKASFDMFDRDGSGEIGANEIFKIMKSIGCPMNKSEIKEIIALIDTSGNGELDFDEFCRFSKYQRKEITKEDLKKMQKEDLKKKAEEEEKPEPVTKEVNVPDEEEEPVEEEEKPRALRAGAKPRKIKKEEEPEEKENEEDEDPVIKAFRHFDKDNKGTITNSEFRTILENLGYRFNPKFVDKLFDTCELTEKGELDYTKFVNGWRPKLKKDIDINKAIRNAHNGVV